MKVLLSPRHWRAHMEGRHLLVSLCATFFGGALSRHWFKLV